MPAERDFRVADLWAAVAAALVGWLTAGLTGLVIVVVGIVIGRRWWSALAGTTVAALVLVALTTVRSALPAGNVLAADGGAATTLGRVAGNLLLASVVVMIIRERVVGSRRSRAAEEPVAVPRAPATDRLVVVTSAIAVAFLGSAFGAALVGLHQVAVAGVAGTGLSIAFRWSRTLARVVSEQVSGDGEHVVRGSSWVMLGFVAQAGTGIIFWIAAARLFPAEDVGLATGLFTSLQFVNFLTAMGLSELLARYQPRGSHTTDPWFSWAVIVTVLTSAVGTVVYLGLVDADTVGPLRDGGVLVGATLFFALSGGSAVALLADARFMTSRRWRLVFWRLLVIGGLRVPLLWIPHGGNDALWIFVVMAGPIAISGLWGAWKVVRAGPSVLGLTVPPALRRPALRFAAVNYLSHLAVLAPQFGLPLIVFLNVSAADNAAFFLAWSITAVAAIMPMTISRVLLSEGSRDETTTDRLAATALRLALGVIGVATVAVLPAERIVVAVYGADYRSAGEMLPMLVAGCFPWAITVIALAYSRVHHDHLGTVITSGAVALGVIGSALFLVPADGIDGGMRAWFLGNVFAAGVAVVMHLRLRATVRRAEVPVAVHEGEGEHGREPALEG